MTATRRLIWSPFFSFSPPCVGGKKKKKTPVTRRGVFLVSGWEQEPVSMLWLASPEEAAGGTRAEKMDGCKDWSWQSVRKAALRCRTCHPSQFCPGRAWVALLFHLLHPLYLLTDTCMRNKNAQQIGTHKLSNTLKAGSVALRLFKSVPLLLFVHGNMFSLRLFERSQSQGWLKGLKQWHSF